jgi:energy-coupling factor transporter ATP-binding protein EcfA2
MEHEIVETIGANQITVIAGDTGCGKTTQVPQLVLDDLILRNQGAAANIIITQPRRTAGELFGEIQYMYEMDLRGLSSSCQGWFRSHQQNCQSSRGGIVLAVLV